MSQSNDLVDFMNSATKEMEADYEIIQKRVTEDPGTAGDQGEESWAELLRSWLSPTFHIETKGRILSSFGTASPQIDVIVLQPDYPKKLWKNKLYLAEGVIAAFECKTTLNSGHIKKFISNSVEVKSKVAGRKGTPYKELHCPLIYGLLAHSHSWKRPRSTPVKNIEEKLIDWDNELITHPIQMPDLLCVADIGCWTSFKTTFFGPRQHHNWETMAAIHGPQGSASSGYIGHTKDMRNQTDTFSPIGALMNSLQHKTAMEYPSLRRLARYFTLTSMQGSGEGKMRLWGSDIYSDEIRSRVEEGQLTNGQLWDEWSVAFS